MCTRTSLCRRRMRRCSTRRWPSRRTSALWITTTASWPLFPTTQSLPPATPWLPVPSPAKCALITPAMVRASCTPVSLSSDAHVPSCQRFADTAGRIAATAHDIGRLRRKCIRRPLCRPYRFTFRISSLQRAPHTSTNISSVQRATTLLSVQCSLQQNSVVRLKDWCIDCRVQHAQFSLLLSVFVSQFRSEPSAPISTQIYRGHSACDAIVTRLSEQVLIVTFPSN
mmetsp:Transcript_20780/g.35693  ORF Transcript_20780/g.35693 Transcript_20780/m.35693 type:complete len:226 (-) Transcript_20780:334-1011(-)